MDIVAAKDAKDAKQECQFLKLASFASLVQFSVLLLGKAQECQPQKMPLPKGAKFYGVGLFGQ